MKKTGVAALALTTSLLAAVPITPAWAASVPSSSSAQQTTPDYDPTNVPDDVPGYSPELDEDLYGEDGGGGSSQSDGTQSDGSSTTPQSGSTGTQPNTGVKQPDTGVKNPATTPAQTPGTKQPVTTPGTKQPVTTPDTKQPTTTPTKPGSTEVVDPTNVPDGSEPLDDEFSGDVPPVDGTTTDGTPQAVLDYSNVPETGGFYVTVSSEAFNMVGVLPKFELQLWNATTNKKLDRVLVSEGNLDKQSGDYVVKFNVPGGFKLGDKMGLLLGKETDPEVANLVFSVFEPEKDQFLTYTLDAKHYTPITISKQWYEGGGKRIYRLYGSQNFPIEGGVKANKTDAIFHITDKSGVPLRGIDLTLQGNYGSKMKEQKIKTDSDGKAVISLTKLSNTFFLSSDKRKVVGDSQPMHSLTLPVWGDNPDLGAPAIYEIAMEAYTPKTAAPASGASAAASSTPTESTATVNFNISGNSDLSKAWMSAQLSLTGKDGKERIFDVTPDNNKLYGLSDGSYNVKVVDNGIANATLASSTVSVSGGTGVINLSLAPKYVLKVDKDGASYSFSVLNVGNISDKKYTGTEAKVFGVAPGESYMVNDNESAANGALNVIIEDGSYETHVILGVGVVKGGTASASSPHTGDTIWYWGSALLLSGAGLAYLLLRRKPKALPGTMKKGGA